MLKCWEENPSDRPTFAKLKDKMKEMERNHKVNIIISVICNTEFMFSTQEVEYIIQFEYFSVPHSFPPVSHLFKI